MSIAAIIVAAGESRRMGFDKLSADLQGKSVLIRSVEAFCECSSIDLIVVVCNEARYEPLEEYFFGKPIHRVDGGNDRQFSVLNGLNALPDDVTIVAIHDGARPLVTTEHIENCLAAAKQYGAATSARKVTDTLKRADAEGFARSGIDRNDLWFMETPQCFRKSLLMRAYNNVNERRLSVTDEVSAVESIGISTKLVESRTINLKITFPTDLEIAAKLI